jgi:hypothetical protein
MNMDVELLSYRQHIQLIMKSNVHIYYSTITLRSGFDSRRRQRIFPVASVSRPALGPTQPPVQWIPGVLSPGVKARPGRDADHSPPSSVEVENE